MYKKCQIIMLSTDIKAEGLGARNWYLPYSKELIIDNLVSNLYILSDDEIKEGDLQLNHLTNKISRRTNSPLEVTDVNCSKVVATTNKSLFIDNGTFDDGTGTQLPKLNTFIPQIPQSFIEYYVSEYNKNNQIKDVMVEYEPANIGQEIIQIGVGDEFVTSWKLKINPDNTINIKPVKESWNRDEVIELLKTGMIHSFKIGNKLFKDFDSTHKIYPHRNPNFYEDKMKKHCEFNNWIDQNL